MASNISSVEELDEIYNTVYNIIDLLDENGIKQLTGGSVKDIDRIIDILVQEARRVIYDIPYQINKEKFYNLDQLSYSIDESLKIINYNYFKTTMLPEFEMQWFNIEWGNLVQIYLYVCILASRGHGKSHEFSLAYPLWRMYGYSKPNDLNRLNREIELRKEGLLITNEFKLGRKLLSKIAAEIASNDLLKERLLPDRSFDLGKDKISTRNGAILELRSFGSQIRGLHPGYIILDDFLDKSSIYSEEQREKFWEVFSAEIMNAIEPGGPVKVVGTPFHNKDLYAKLKTDKRWKVFEYPGVFPDGTLLNPKRFSLQSLLALKESLGSTIFSREILVTPVSDDSTIFPYSILEKAFIGMQNVSLTENIHSFPVKFKKIVIGCDFAISANVGADYACFATLGLDSLENIWLINLWRKKGASHNEQISQLQRLNAAFNPNEILMEVNGFQRVMYELAIQAGLRNAREWVTDGWNKKDLYNGLPSLAVLFERGCFKLPRGDENSRQLTDIVCSEFNSISFDSNKGKLEAISGHDDIPMSVFIGTRGLFRVSSQIEISYINF